MSEYERSRLLALWRAEAATYNFSMSMSTTIAQAYAIKVLKFDLELLGTMVLVHLGTLGVGYLLGSIVVSVFRNRRILFWKAMGLLNRCLWALTGFSHNLPSEHRAWAFLTAIATAQLSGSIAAVASGDVGADLVGRERAVKFFSSLNSTNLVANSLGLVVATVFFNLLPEEEGYVATYSTSLAFSAISSGFLLMLKDVDPPASRTSIRDLVKDFTDVTRSSSCTSYIKVAALFTFIVNLPGALWNYYLLNVLGGNETWVTMKAIAANLSQSAGFRVWSRVSRRLGLKKTLYVGIALTSPIPTAFIFLPSLPGQIALEVYSGFVWAAYNLANSIYTLYLPKRVLRVYFIATLNVSVNTLASVASRVGASVASVSLLAMNSVFIASTLGRVIASVLARRSAPEVPVR
ncbi:MAG: MFS transporter [Sulfolobales archaeon]